MGKKQHQKDKMYLTTTEWSTLYGGKKAGKFLDQFTQLGAFDAQLRISAIANIVGCIFGDDAEIDDADDEQPEAEKTKADRKGYTLKRLIRGLSSSNRCSRIGFSDALAEVLRRVDYSVEQVLQLMDEWLPLKPKEDRVQMMIGRLLAWAALIRASKLKGDLAKCVSELIVLSGKPFLESAVCSLVSEIVSSAEKKTFEKVAWPLLDRYLQEHTKSPMPFYVYVILTLRQQYPHLVAEYSLPTETLVSTLQMSCSQLPQIHPLVSTLLKQSRTREELETFWSEVVEKLALSPSVEKHFLLLHIMQMAFTTYESLDVLMKEVYVEQLVYPLVKTNSPLNAQVKSFIAVLENLDKSKAKSILKFILSHNKGYRFDHMTKSSLVHKTLLKAEPEVVRWFAKRLQKKLQELQSNKENDESHIKFDTIIIEQLANLTHLSNMHGQPDFKRSVCEYLSNNYFSGDARISKKPNTQAFLKALAPANNPKALSEAADNIFAVLQIYTQMENRHASFKHEKKLRSAAKLMEKLNKSDKNPDSKLALRIFVGYLALCYALNIQQDVTVLDDVVSAAKAFMAGRHEEDEVDWIDLVMEAIISALSVENAHFRSIMLMTLALIHKEITSEALAILLSVFHGDEPPEDLSQLEEDPSDEEDDEDSDSDDEDDDKSSDGQNGNAAQDESSSEVDFGDESFRNQLSTVLGVDGSDNDEEIEATDEDMMKLDKAIAAAFGARFKALSSSTNKENRKKELQALHFEMKCLHILEDYVKSPNIPMSHIISICKALLTFATSKRAKNVHRPIVSHIAETLRDLTSLKVSSIKNDSSIEDVKALGQLVAEKIQTVFDAELRVALNGLLPFVVKCVKLLGDDQDWYFGLYREFIGIYLEQQSTPVAPPLFVRFIEVFNEHSLFIVDALQSELSGCMEKREKRVQMMGLLVAALKLCNSANVDKKKLKKSLKKLASSVSDVLKRGEELAFTMNLYVELLDVVRLISQKCKEADLDDPMTGHLEAFKAIFDDLSKKNMPTQIKRRLNSVYRHFFPGEQFSLQKGNRKKKHNGVETAEEEMEVDIQENGSSTKKRKLSDSILECDDYAL